MMLSKPFDALPLWTIGLITVALIMLAVEAGMWLGRSRRRALEKKGEAVGGESQAGTVIGAMLGLLAFTLGFTFAFAASRFEDRRQAMVHETNAIGTTYLRTRLLPDPFGADMRRLLREYVDIRVAAVTNPTEAKIRQAVVDSEKVQEKLWLRTVELVKVDQKLPIDALYVASLNEMIDCQTTRLAVSRFRIPPVVWAVLYEVAVLSMGALGFIFGYSGRGGTGLNLIMAIVFGTVIVLVADLDNPVVGNLQVSQTPMIELQKSINEGPP
ncbi:MAG: hypothetical protein WC869_13620 [Phycisphaerae bacterium]|jgi:hypothetical protein